MPAFVSKVILRLLVAEGEGSVGVKDLMVND
jgi:hypothetical protein